MNMREQVSEEQKAAIEGDGSFGLAVDYFARGLEDDMGDLCLAIYNIAENQRIPVSVVLEVVFGEVGEGILRKLQEEYGSVL